MINKSSLSKLSLVLTMIFAAALSRLVPHYPNFTAVNAVLLLGAFKFRKDLVLAIAAPLVAVLLTDLVLGLSSSLIYLYITYGLLAVLASVAVDKVDAKAQGRTLIIGSLSISTLFFVISNFGLWLQGSMYPITAQGLLTCFTLALPFYANQIAGDLFYTGIVFGLAYLLEKRFAVKARA